MSDGQFRQRVIERTRLMGRDLVPHPENRRFHGDDQVGAMLGVLDEVGQVGELYAYREHDGTLVLINGHMRAGRWPDQQWDVAITDLSAEEGRKVLALYDPLGSMAAADPAQFDSLLRGLETGSAELQSLLAQTADDMGLYRVDGGGDDAADPDDAAADGEPEADPVPPDIPQFESDPEWGIPILDAGMQASRLVVPVTKWGTIARSGPMPGTYHYYTADAKFATICDSPGPAIASGCQVVVEPNYSAVPGHPRALALADVSRKRFFTRLCQHYGIRAIVDLNVAAEFRALNLLGVPRGWRSYATRSHKGVPPGSIAEEHALAVEHAGTEDVFFAVFGGGRKVRDECRSRGWTWVAEDSDQKRGKTDDGQGT